ncbi:Aspartic proteinase CDR1, partial [Mucuna pruriens]
MSYSLGTPPFQVYGVVDTCSDIIWVQDQLCEACYSDTSFTFGPSYSKTDATVVSGHGTVSTPIFHHAGQTYYYLSLRALHVGNKRIKFESSSSRSSEKGNIIIDSGTTFTLLPHDVYSKLESVVADAVKLDRVEDPLKQLSLCYKTTFDQLHVHVPVITAHFRSAHVKLNAIKTFIEAGHGVVCLAFLSTQTSSIFGNRGQQNFLVGYDLQKKMVSFKPTDYAKH